MSDHKSVSWSTDEVHMLVLIASHIDPQAPIPDDPRREWTEAAKAAIYKARSTMEYFRD